LKNSKLKGTDTIRNAAQSTEKKWASPKEKKARSGLTGQKKGRVLEMDRQAPSSNCWGNEPVGSRFGTRRGVLTKKYLACRGDQSKKIRETAGSGAVRYHTEKIHERKPKIGNGKQRKTISKRRYGQGWEVGRSEKKGENRENTR